MYEISAATCNARVAKMAAAWFAPNSHWFGFWDILADFQWPKRNFIPTGHGRRTPYNWPKSVPYYNWHHGRPDLQWGHAVALCTLCPGSWVPSQVGGVLQLIQKLWSHFGAPNAVESSRTRRRFGGHSPLSKVCWVWVQTPRQH